MAQDDYNIPNQSFPSFRSDLNSALSAINSSNSGTSRPSSAVAGTIWLDTSGGATANTLKFYDGADDISLANINTTANTVDWLDSSVVSDLVNDTSPQLGGQLDVNGNAIGDGTLELIKFIETVSAVNEITVTNSATGNAPEISATGDDTNIDLKLTPKGSGKLNLDGIKFPNADGSADQILKTDGSGNLSFTDAGGGTNWQSSIVTATTLTAEAGKGYWINTTSNACTITLPASASVGDTIEFSDYLRTWGNNSITLNTNSLNFQGNTSPNPVYNTSGQSVRLVYSGATQGWIPTVDDDVTYETDQSYSADFLVIAGGGGGAQYGGGGGAGGYRTSYATDSSGGGGSTETDLALTPGTVYTITVGGGGAGAGSSPSASGTSGSDSTISGSDITNIVSDGGGFGKSSGAGVGSVDGGSGGGVDSGTGGNGTANQGFDGGNGGSGNLGGGGGGGAGAVGANGGLNEGGNGGNGVAGTITASSVTRAGGGGGGADNRYTGSGSPGSGGSGGGGNGTVDGTAGTGTANTGSGGGGAAYGSGYGTASAGGSGLIVLRMATSNYSGTTSGSPTVTTSGADTIITFNASGSYTG